MKTQVLNIIVGLQVLGLMASPVFASKTKPRKLDTYSATEEGPSEEVIRSAPGYRAAEAVEAAEPVAAAPAPAATPSSKFDTVPGSQTEPLLRRLKLVEALILKYGRAYDYRSLTVTELQSILGKLDVQSAQASEVRHRASARAEEKKQILSAPAAAPKTDEIPAPLEDGIGSEAPPAEN